MFGQTHKNNSVDTNSSTVAIKKGVVWRQEKGSFALLIYYINDFYTCLSHRLSAFAARWLMSYTLTQASARSVCFAWAAPPPA